MFTTSSERVRNAFTVRSKRVQKTFQTHLEGSKGAKKKKKKVLNALSKRVHKRLETRLKRGQKHF